MDPQEVLEVCVNKYEKGFGWLYNQFVQLNKKWFIVFSFIHLWKGWCANGKSNSWLISAYLEFFPLPGDIVFRDWFSKKPIIVYFAKDKFLDIGPYFFEQFK